MTRTSDVSVGFHPSAADGKGGKSVPTVPKHKDALILLVALGLTSSSRLVTVDLTTELMHRYPYRDQLAEPLKHDTVAQH